MSLPGYPQHDGDQDRDGMRVWKTCLDILVDADGGGVATELISQRALLGFEPLNRGWWEGWGVD